MQEQWECIGEFDKRALVGLKGFVGSTTETEHYKASSGVTLWVIRENLAGVKKMPWKIVHKCLI